MPEVLAAVDIHILAYAPGGRRVPSFRRNNAASIFSEQNVSQSLCHHKTILYQINGSYTSPYSLSSSHSGRVEV